MRIGDTQLVQASAQPLQMGIQQKRPAVVYRYDLVNGVAKQETAIEW